MRIKCYHFSENGAVRDHNEDAIVFWEHEDPEVRLRTGSVAVLCDGVGGSGHGEVASALAVEAALGAFREAAAETPLPEILRRAFEAASMRVFQEGQNKGRMATTMVMALFRHGQVAIGHVGDSRAYLVRAGKIRRLTTDHSYTAMQVKLGLLLERKAMTSEHRSTLTRSVGAEPMCHFDLVEEPLQRDDVVLLCSDGVYGFVLDDEMLEAVSKCHPAEACKRIRELAYKRQVSDNLSLQLLQVREVDAVQKTVPAYVQAGLGGAGVGIGQLLDDRFEITDLIAKSGMGSLYKATDRKTGGPVALKIPHLQIESDAGGFDRFKREEEIGIRLNNPNILKMFSVEKKSRPYIVMEYLEGQTLGDLLKSIRPLPEADAVAIAARLCGALDYMHKNGVVHRDMKPQNIMICNDGSLRIMDFGIARAMNSRRLTFVGFTPAMGTPDYMAPEQVKGSRGDERTDIYSLGAILYEMTTGEPPFGGDSPYVIMNARVTGDPVAPRTINPKLTPVVEEIILHAMERDPKRRHPTAAALKAELEDFEKVEITGRCSRLQAPQVWKSKFSLLPVILGLVALNAIGFVLLMLYFKKKQGG
jgi:serine/threonine protein phosphatase PrpC